VPAERKRPKIVTGFDYFWVVLGNDSTNFQPSFISFKLML